MALRRSDEASWLKSGRVLSDSTSASFTTDHQRRRRVIRHSLATMDRNQARSELWSPRSLLRFRHALTAASWTASSAAIRAESIAAASLYVVLSRRSRTIANEFACRLVQ